MKILQKIDIVQGNSSPTIKLGVSGVKTLAGYTCEMNVIDTSGQEVVASRAITEIIVDGTNEAFALNLRASETALLTPDSLYIWAIQITNDSVFYKDETRIGVFIKKPEVSI